MNRNKRRKNKKTKPKNKSDKPIVIVCGILLTLIFCWLTYSGKTQINEKELLTIKGLLNSELKQEYTGGTQKTYFWTFKIKNEPIKFSIGGNAYGIFNSAKFKKLENKNSNIVIKVNKDYYSQLRDNYSNNTDNVKVGVKYLESNNDLYFNVSDYNSSRKTDYKYSYVFLIIGLSILGFGIRMK